MNVDTPIPDYLPGFKSALEGLLYDTELSDFALLDRAREHLKVLDDPAFSDTSNMPFQDPLSQRYTVTVKGVFDAMYHTAEAFDMKEGHRYVSAGICASCDQLSPGRIKWQSPYLPLAKDGTYTIAAASNCTSEGL
ncbi:hypothetical protein K466DRAFT_599010 [Polyporus arcularius HHB13444]|uniref:Uncharacterized protein n=1 Tax=Polyporus arcularius HHB13444 TaxID=1314778 RepID=A0A5C3PI40_9APHY|nr:hypothetical protein K466DRAFT_599010 [Polyporus arcularius HHB13444]